MSKIIFQMLTILMSFQAIADDYGSHGKFVVKGKLQGLIPSVKSSNSLQNIEFNNKSYSSMVNTSAGNVVGIEASGTYFLSDNFAIETSTGYIIQKIKVTGKRPYYYYGDGTVATVIDYQQATKAGYIPFAAAVQYHIAPYGKLSPYVGVGYHYTFATASSGSVIGQSKGIIFQGGVDGWINDNLMFNIGIKKTTMNPKITFKRTYIADQDSILQVQPTSSSIKLDPMMISFGLGVRL